MTPMQLVVIDAVRLAKGKPYEPSTRIYAEIADGLCDAGVLVRVVPGRPVYILAQAALPGVA